MLCLRFHSIVNEDCWFWQRDYPFSSRPQSTPCFRFCDIHSILKASRKSRGVTGLFRFGSILSGVGGLSGREMTEIIVMTSFLSASLERNQDFSRKGRTSKSFAYEQRARLRVINPNSDISELLTILVEVLIIFCAQKHWRNADVYTYFVTRYELIFTLNYVFREWKTKTKTSLKSSELDA